MKKIRRKAMAVLISASFVITSVSFINGANGNIKAQAAGILESQKDMLTYSNKLAEDSDYIPEPIHQVEKTDKDGNFLQFVYEDDKGNPVNMESEEIHKKAVKKKMTLKGAAAQASYTSPYAVTPVKNQGLWSTCWAFAATAAIEANVIKNSAKISTVKGDASLDLSESHLTWFGQNTYSTSSADTSYGDGVKKTDSMKVYGSSGGQDYKTAYYLARGSGMDFEIDAPYTGYDMMDPLLENMRYSSTVQMHDFYRMGYTADASSIAKVKELVNNYGAATAGYYSAESGYKTASDGRLSYCSKGYANSGVGVAHEVCIVGWDDNYAVLIL